MNAYWQIWRGLLTPAECDRIIESAMEIPPTEATVGNQDNHRMDLNIRRSTLRWIYKQDANWEFLWRRVYHLFNEANDNAFGFDLSHIQSLQFTTYEASSAGHYDWHEDVQWKTPLMFHRKLSMVVMLTDPSTYEGGDLALQIPDSNPQTEELRSRGTVLVFPSFVRHRVSPVTKGTRHSLVAWHNGPKFK